MANSIKISLIVALVVAVTACSDRQNLSPMPSVSADAKRELKQPVNCATAKQDVATLQAEEASVAKQMISGVRSVFPIAAAAGILMGDYRDRVQVATGQYNSDLEAKIAEIKATCKLK